MKFAAIQFYTAWEDKNANFTKVADLVQQAADQGARCVVLPEMFSTGFTMNPEPFAEKIPGPTLTFLQELCTKHQIYIYTSYIEKDIRHYNTGVAVSPEGELLCKYRKLHLFRDEKDFYLRGDRLNIFAIDDINAAPIVCYDLRFPELFRPLFHAGVQIALVPANWPIRRIEHWDCLLRARGIDFQMFVLGVNRVGKSPQLYYPGWSALYDPWGECLFKAGEEEEVLIADIDVNRIKEARSKLSMGQDFYPEAYRF